ncbi:MAG: hypothetical protein V4490_06120, partial [Pseudomonadota bacterium]
ADLSGKQCSFVVEQLTHSNPYHCARSSCFVESGYDPISLRRAILKTYYVPDAPEIGQRLTPNSTPLDKSPHMREAIALKSTNRLIATGSRKVRYATEYYCFQSMLPGMALEDLPGSICGRQEVTPTASLFSKILLPTSLYFYTQAILSAVTNYAALAKKGVIVPIYSQEQLRIECSGQVHYSDLSQASVVDTNASFFCTPLTSPWHSLAAITSLDAVNTYLQRLEEQLKIDPSQITNLRILIAFFYSAQSNMTKDFLETLLEKSQQVERTLTPIMVTLAKEYYASSLLWLVSFMGPLSHYTHRDWQTLARWQNHVEPTERVESNLKLR